VKELNVQYSGGESAARPGAALSRPAAPQSVAPIPQALTRKLREIGLVLLHCDPFGKIIHESATTSDDQGSESEQQSEAAHQQRAHGATTPTSSDWLRELFVRSPLFLDSMCKASTRWRMEDEQPALDLFPGCWLVPLPRCTRRRRCTGYDVAVILTDAFLGAEQLASMCQSAQQDQELCTRMLRALPLANQEDVPRLTALIRLAHEDDARMRADNEAMENVGQQLAESYEEINLLYTIIQSMTLEEQPERFLQFVCEELLATMPFTWIGVVLKREPDGSAIHGRFKSLAEQLIVAGTPTEPLEDVRAAALRALDGALPEASLVLEPAFNPDHEPYRALGHNAFVQPVKHRESVVGVLIAGEKRGPDLAVSSVDMKLVNATATHVSIFLENATLYDNLNAMFLGTLEALTASIDAKDRYTCGHSQRVAHLTRALAESLGQDEATLKRMHIAGLVHDVGKIGVPESVLLKPGKLTEEEFAWIRLHPEMGFRILKDIPQLNDVLPGVLHHHERWDGRGYPHGLAGADIPLIARLIALADSFDAMSSSRTYRKAMSRSTVLEEIRRNAGTQFDPNLVPAFVSLDFGEYDRLVSEHRATEQRIGAAPGEAA
jgi:HD-GYP domain-containing protein (c-di-GMP phosphodiesterase class II)